jgi:hypothetical protein
VPVQNLSACTKVYFTLQVAWPLKKYPVFRENRWFINAFTTVRRQVHTLNQVNVVHYPVSLCPLNVSSPYSRLIFLNRESTSCASVIRGLHGFSSAAKHEVLFLFLGLPVLNLW